MKRLALMLTTIAAITLGGCTTVPTGQTLVDAVVADIRIGCSVVIGVADLPGIQALIGTVPFGTTAVSIAQLACQAFQLQAPKSVRLRTSRNVSAIVNGVRITGTIQ